MEGEAGEGEAAQGEAAQGATAVDAAETPTPDEVLLARLEVPLGVIGRILLTTDGTVTRIIEAYAGERIMVTKLAEEVGMAGVGEGEAASLELDSPAEAVRRTILLTGSLSGTHYLHADLVAVLSRLDPRVAERLLGTDEPVGRLLVQARAETFREVLEAAAEPAGQVGELLGVPPSAPLVVRRYRVVSGARPVLLVTERFPAAGFEGRAGSDAPRVS